MRWRGPNENAQPTFGDDESVDRSVDENAKGANVGDPVTATDGDGDPLLYTLSGDGSDAFKVNNSGQITTAKELDFEAQAELHHHGDGDRPVRGQRLHRGEHHRNRRR